MAALASPVRSRGDVEYFGPVPVMTPELVAMFCEATDEVIRNVAACALYAPEGPERGSGIQANRFCNETIMLSRRIAQVRGLEVSVS